MSTFIKGLSMFYFLVQVARLGKFLYIKAIFTSTCACVDLQRFLSLRDKQKSSFRFAVIGSGSTQQTDSDVIPPCTQLQFVFLAYRSCLLY